MVGLLLAALVLAACPSSSSGFFCPMTGFSGTDCTQRISTSTCQDGGVVGRPLIDGGTQLCCAWDNCSSDPYPELSNP
jgi:hypothetical protein